MQGSVALLNLQTTAGRTKRTFGFSYPSGDQVNPGCGAEGASSPTADGDFVQTQGYANLWHLSAMQIGEVRATGVGFFANTPGIFRWMRTLSGDHQCSDLVAAYRQDATTWQVATSLVRLRSEATPSASSMAKSTTRVIH
jgi:hypothetical protein